MTTSRITIVHYELSARAQMNLLTSSLRELTQPPPRKRAPAFPTKMFRLEKHRYAVVCCKNPRGGDSVTQDFTSVTCELCRNHILSWEFNDG